MSRIGFFGGSFNPPTIAHLEIVKLAICEANLDKLVIVPMGDKYEKHELIPFKYRYEMLLKMFENNEKVKISNIQENQMKKSYAIDTFKIIKKLYVEDEKFFIMGLDNFSNIANWKNSNELLNEYEYIVFGRNNIPIDIELEIVKFINISQNVSSTEARFNIKNNKDVENILTKEVISYINKNGLYKGDL